MRVARKGSCLGILFEVPSKATRSGYCNYKGANLGAGSVQGSLKASRRVRGLNSPNESGLGIYIHYNIL